MYVRKSTDVSQSVMGDTPEFNGNGGMLISTDICGDRVVYDTNSSLFWYPHLLEMVQMTRAEQQAYIDNLNAIAYGKRTDWHFATLDQVFSLKTCFAAEGENIQWTGPPGPSTPRMVWPVNQVSLFFPATDVIPIPRMGNMVVQVYNGRTADDWGLRRDPDNTTAVRFGEAADHFVVQSRFTPGEFATFTYNYDQHYMADDAIIMTSMQWFFGDLECSAWVVSAGDPEIFEGCAELSTPDMSYKGSAELHILQDIILLHFEEEWLKWNICYRDIQDGLEYLCCEGDLGFFEVYIFDCGSHFHVVGMGELQSENQVNFYTETKPN